MRIDTWKAGDGLAARDAARTAARRRRHVQDLAARATAARALPPDLQRPDPVLLTAMAAALDPTKGTP